MLRKNCHQLVRTYIDCFITRRGGGTKKKQKGTYDEEEEETDWEDKRWPSPILLRLHLPIPCMYHHIDHQLVLVLIPCHLISETNVCNREKKGREKKTYVVLCWTRCLGITSEYHLYADVCVTPRINGSRTKKKNEKKKLVNWPLLPAITEKRTSFEWYLDEILFFFFFTYLNCESYTTQSKTRRRRRSRMIGGRI